MQKHMNPIQRGKIKRYVEAGGLLVVMEVPVIYAPEEPQEPLLEAKTIRLLDEAIRRVRSGDRAWLRRHGKVYSSNPAGFRQAARKATGSST